MLFASGALVLTCIVVGSVTAVKEHAFDASALILAIMFGWPLYYFNRPKVRLLFT